MPKMLYYNCVKMKTVLWKILTCSKCGKERKLVAKSHNHYLLCENCVEASLEKN